MTDVGGPQPTSKIESLLCAAQAIRSNYVEFYPGGETVTMPVPRIIGPGRCAPITGVTRKVFLTCVDDATVFSRYDGIATAGRMLFDYQGHEIDNILADCPPNQFIYDGPDVFAIHPIHSRPAIDIPEALTLVGNNSVNFGHWIIEHLLQWSTASGRPELRDVPILIDDELPAQHRQALEFFVRGRVPIVVLPKDGIARVRRLWKVSNWIYVPFYWTNEAAIHHEFIVWPVREVIAQFRKLAESIDRHAGMRQFSKRVFLSRGNAFHRKLLNLAETESIAREYGFEVYHPEELEFSEQLSLVGGASHIIGPEGSAFFLAFFGTPGTRLCAFDNPFIEKAGYAAALYPELGIDLVLVTGDCTRKDELFTGFSDYVIDPSDVRRVLDEWDSAPAHSRSA